MAETAKERRAREAQDAKDIETRFQQFAAKTWKAEDGDGEFDYKDQYLTAFGEILSKANPDVQKIWLKERLTIILKHKHDEKHRFRFHEKLIDLVMLGEEGTNNLPVVWAVSSKDDSPEVKAENKKNNAQWTAAKNNLIDTLFAKIEEKQQTVLEALQDGIQNLDHLSIDRSLIREWLVVATEAAKDLETRLQQFAAKTWKAEEDDDEFDYKDLYSTVFGEVLSKASRDVQKIWLKERLELILKHRYNDKHRFRPHEKVIDLVMLGEEGTDNFRSVYAVTSKDDSPEVKAENKKNNAQWTAAKNNLIDTLFAKIEEKQQTVLEALQDGIRKLDELSIDRGLIRDLDDLEFVASDDEYEQSAWESQKEPSEGPLQEQGQGQQPRQLQTVTAMDLQDRRTLNDAKDALRQGNMLRGKDLLLSVVGRSAEAKYEFAMLAIYSEHVSGVHTDQATDLNSSGMRMLVQAAAVGSVDALYELGNFQIRQAIRWSAEDSKGTAPDKSGTTKRLYRRGIDRKVEAASKGHVAARYDIAMHNYMIRVADDSLKSANLDELAATLIHCARQNHPPAMMQLGVLVGKSGKLDEMQGALNLIVNAEVLSKTRARMEPWKPHAVFSAPRAFYHIAVSYLNANAVEGKRARTEVVVFWLHHTVVNLAQNDASEHRTMLSNAIKILINVLHSRDRNRARVALEKYKTWVNDEVWVSTMSEALERSEIG